MLVDPSSLSSSSYSSFVKFVCVFVYKYEGRKEVIEADVQCDFFENFALQQTAWHAFNFNC